MNDFLKYYWLEHYLETEVYDYFHAHHYLTPEQFFAIVFWKSKRPRRLIREGFNEGSVERLMQSVFDAVTKEDRLRLLLNQRGFNLAMASAVLTVLYPNDFTVYDKQVREILGLKDISSLPSGAKIKKYFDEYITKVKASNPDLSLRNCDRALWAESWHKDLQEFIQSVSNFGRNRLKKDLKQEYETK